MGNVVAALYIPEFGSLYRVSLPSAGSITLSSLINNPQTIVTGFPPQTDLNMGFHRIFNLGLDVSNGDALSRGQSTTRSLADVSGTAPISGQAFIFNGSQWGGAAMPSFLTWDGALGAFTSAAVSPAVAACNGHFTQLTCTATLTGSCTTGPTIDVADITTSTVGVTVSPTTTVAVLAQSAQTLAFSSGDTIALIQAATTSACTAPAYSCTAVYTCP